MKILHVNKFFDLHGGADVYVQDIMRHQQEAGHEVHALSTFSSKNQPSKDERFFVKRYDYDKRESPVLDAKKALSFLWNREAERAMTQALKELQPDVVHLHNLYHHLSSSVLRPIRRSGIACVQTLHDLKLACPNYKMYTEGSPCDRCKGGHYTQAIRHHCLSSSFLPNALAALEMGMTKAMQSYERTVHTFVCPSQFMKQKMEHWGEPPSKLRVVLMPMNMMDAPAKRDGGYLLAVGRLSPEKGYQLLIQAAARTPAVKIKIAGRGPEEAKLTALIKEHDIKNVELVGFKQGEELEKLYREAQAFLACPIGYENAPLSVLDALGYGLPLIVTNFGGLQEMVKQGKNGWLVERQDEDAWVEALHRFSALSSIEQDIMARESRRLAESYPDWAKHLKALENLYKEAQASKQA